MANPLPVSKAVKAAAHGGFSGLFTTALISIPVSQLVATVVHAVGSAAETASEAAKHAAEASFSQALDAVQPLHVAQNFWNGTKDAISNDHIGVMVAPFVGLKRTWDAAVASGAPGVITLLVTLAAGFVIVRTWKDAHPYLRAVAIPFMGSAVMLLPWLAARGFAEVLPYVATALPALIGITIAIVDKLLEHALVDWVKGLFRRTKKEER